MDLGTSVDVAGASVQSSPVQRDVKNPIFPPTRVLHGDMVANDEKSRTLSRNDVDTEQILSFVPPQWDDCPYPYPSKRNPFFVEAEAEAFAWVYENGLEGMYKSPKVLFAAIKGEVMGVSMRVYLNAGRELAIWACQFYLWMFALDDYLDEAEYFSSPEKTAALFLELNLAIMWSYPDNAHLRRNLITILSYAGSQSGTSDSVMKYVDSKLALAKLHPDTTYRSSLSAEEPLLKALLLIWDTVTTSCPSEFVIRWGILLQEYIISNMVEVKNRSNNTVPAFEEICEMRRTSSASYLCTVVLEMLNQTFLPDKIFYTKELQALLVAVGDFIGWMNDLTSFKKEALKGDMHNLVAIYRHEKGCSYQEAGEIVFQMCLKKVADVEETANILTEITPKEHLEAVQNYIEGARIWLSAAYYWHYNSARYFPTSTFY